MHMEMVNTTGAVVEGKIQVMPTLKLQVKKAGQFIKAHQEEALIIGLCVGAGIVLGRRYNKKGK